MEQSTFTAQQPLTPQQLRALHNNLNRDRVATRSNMSYLEAWDVKATLIRVFGYAGFSAECLDAKIIREEQVEQVADKNKMNWSVSAQATVRITIHQTGAVFTESAIANNKQPDWAEAADTALKSAESDALKRAAIYLGTQFGLSLYDSGTTADVVKTVLAPDQAASVALINTSRVDSAEGAAARERLQAVLKVHQPTVTEVPTVVAEPTVTEPPAPAPAPVATVTSPVVKAMQNAERVGQELDQAEQEAQPPTAPAKARATRKSPAKAKPTVSADKQAVARQALARAERSTGTTPVGGPGDPYLTNYGPGSPEFVMDDEIQAREDAGL